MTQTATWITRKRSELGRIRLGGYALLGIGLVGVAFTAGVLFGRAGLYRVHPALAFLGWLAAVAGIVFAIISYRRRMAELSASSLAARIETATNVRRGFLSGLVSDLPRSASDDLGRLADRRATEWLNESGDTGLRPVRREVSRGTGKNAMLAAAGVVALIAAGPANENAAGFWNPVGAVIEANGPVSLSVPDTNVRFGDAVTVSIRAAGRFSAELWQRAPGEPWGSVDVTLDRNGRATFDLGELRGDRFVRAVAGSRSSDTLHISVALPALITDMSVVARYPAYLGLPAEPITPGDTLLIPVGTRISTDGRLTLPLDVARWLDGGRDTVNMGVSGAAFSGEFTVRTSGTWTLEAITTDGTPVDAGDSRLPIIAVPDSFPEATFAVPGADTTPPLSLIQPLVLDVRDDHLVTRVELVSRRAGRFADEAPRVEPVPLPEGGTDRTILQWRLDLNDRGFAPGDTAYYRARVWDNSPGNQMTETREYALRLPSRRELRDDVMERSDAVSALADSLARAQAALNRLSEELAAERNRNDADESQLDFNSAERAQQMAEEQSRLMQQAEQLESEISDLADMAREAGITDPEFYGQLDEIRELLEQAISNDLREKLQQLRDALERLDSRSAQEALEDLQATQEEMREQLERSRDLFERAALEGELSAMAEEAQELADEQGAINENQSMGDSTLAALESELAARTDSLRSQLQEMGSQMAEMNAGEGMERPQQAAGEAATQMQNAAQQASQGDTQAARQSGETARQNLESLPDDIRGQRDQMRQQWRQEVIDAMDRALTEVADLATRQSDIARNLESGDTDQSLRGEQAAVRDGVDRVIEELQEASSKNALVSPRLSTALGFAMVKMTEALQQLAQASPNAREAAEAAGAAVDGLNQVAHGLVRGRADVEGSESGTGLEEALERLTQMARQQQGLNGEANQLLPMMSMGGDQLVQQLRELAMQQMQLAEELERIEAEDDVGGLDELADEARDLSRRLEAAQLDRNTIRRQEQLFRRMLDAGRTLRSDRPDDRLERRSETAQGVDPRIPETTDARGAGLRFSYPDWESLSRLSPEERRLVLDYFRRINESRN